MVWCVNCAKDVIPGNDQGKICCQYCGKVLAEDNFSEEATFVKNAGGQSQLSGNYVNSIQSEYSASRERTLYEAEEGIKYLMNVLQIDGKDSISRPALSFYTIALERNFTRGRRKDQVQAACLYIACRVNNKPHLLIDFSEVLEINVYVLGAVFLQLSKLLSLEEHPIVQKPVDPSLFIHKFTDGLFKDRNLPNRRPPNVLKTALHIVASMKRDWMQTGRKPSGLCGAALYISALAHGHKCTKNEIIKVVHICETTLTKRLIEFENTDSGGLTIEEFNQRAEELDNEERLRINSLDTAGVKASGITELLCEHKGSGKPPFAHGLCESCFEEFVKLSGGLDGGSEPPAFQRAERERLLAEEAAAQRSNNLDSSSFLGPVENTSKILNSNEQRSIKHPNDSDISQPAEAASTGANDSGDDKTQTADATVGEESDSLSDIEDTEVDFYLHTEEEKKLKEIIWKEMNKEYLEEQKAKADAAEAAQKAFEAQFSNCAEAQAAKNHYAPAFAAAAKSKKERQQKRAAEAKNAGPPGTAGEAVRRALDKKRVGSKINFDVLNELLNETENYESNKKSRTEAEHDVGNGKEEAEIDDTGDTYSENVQQLDFEDYIDYF